MKPIFLIGCPALIGLSTLDRVRDELSSHSIKDDYHVLVYMSREDDYKFEMFNSDDADDVTIEEVKKYIKELSKE